MGNILSLSGMAAVLSAKAVGFYEAEQKALGRVVRQIEKTARGEFGEYQPSIGAFPEWPELADETQRRREAAGYSPNDPLLVTGKMREHTKSEVHGLEGFVGSTSPLMPIHEFGTEHIPARPVIGPALVANEDFIARVIGGAVFGGVTNVKPGGDEDGDAGEAIHSNLGYDGRTIEPFP